MAMPPRPDQKIIEPSQASGACWVLGQNTRPYNIKPSKATFGNTQNDIKQKQIPGDKIQRFKKTIFSTWPCLGVILGPGRKKLGHLGGAMLAILVQVVLNGDHVVLGPFPEGPPEGVPPLKAPSAPDGRPT